MSNSEIIALLSALAALGGTLIAWLNYKKSKNSSAEESPSITTTTNVEESSGNTIVISGENNSSNININANPQGLIAINFEKEDTRELWKVYEVAFLWHGFEPPATLAHFSKMTREVERTKAMLHKAIREGKLNPSQERRAGIGITRWVSRENLVDYCTEQGFQPPFLFPEARN